MSNNREGIKEHIEHLKKIGIDTESCFECGNKKDIEYHHIIPYAWGGRRVIPLCGNCHNMVHKGRKRRDSVGELVKAAYKKKKQEAIAAGKEFKWGNPEISKHGDKAREIQSRKMREWWEPILIMDAYLYKLVGLSQGERVDKLNEMGYRTRPIMVKGRERKGSLITPQNLCRAYRQLGYRGGVAELARKVDGGEVILAAMDV